MKSEQFSTGILLKLSLEFNPRVLNRHFIDKPSIALEMKRIGSTSEGLKFMVPKSDILQICLDNVPRKYCNIIKQEALAKGQDACVHKDIVTEKIDRSGILITATEAGLELILRNLSLQPWDLPKIAQLIRDTVERSRRNIFEVNLAQNRSLKLSSDVVIMGILNVTPDSFYDGGKYFSLERSLERAESLIKAGAVIIDVGGESTRPGSDPVTAAEEIKRVIPVIEFLKNRDVVVSVDTYKSEVAERALEKGAHIVNDISGMTFDKNMIKIVKKFRSGSVLMHIQGAPKTMQNNPHYADVCSEVLFSLRRSVAELVESGISESQIIIDPGFGFGKLPYHNIKLLKKLSIFRSLGLPVLVGLSRKSFLGQYTGLEDPKERLLPTLASTTIAILNGANIVRVHDAEETKQITTFLNVYRSTR
ncbi:MAG: dihydropteroate synthase [Planctomycetes bacterium]|nr:dihydropteroate synthase [Planctomycetota bacterium]